MIARAVRRELHSRTIICTQGATNNRVPESTLHVAVGSAAKLACGPPIWVTENGSATCKATIDD